MTDLQRDPTCLFCKIIAGEIATQKLYETADAIVIADINPQAPVHALVIPRRHIASIADITAADGATMTALIDAANTVARQSGLDASGFRLVINHGANAGQSVPHLHIHVLGGQPMGWPPFPTTK